jgi:very-short-patch-repair endonuclease
MSRKFTYDEVKLFVESLGYILISDNYINSNIKLILIDKEGYYYLATLKELQKGCKPDRFSKFNLYTIQNIRLWCKLNSKPFELISEAYINNKGKLEWKCLEKNCGEIFKSTWNDIYNGCGCGYCNGKQAGLSNCLATKNPKLTKEWHPTKNDSLTPYNVTPNSTKRVWWQCLVDSRHEWKTDIVSRNKGNGCPYCYGRYATEENNLLIINPKMCGDWNYQRNKKLPQEYTTTSHYKVWWKCKKCNHEWYVSINSRSDGAGCPACAGKIPTETNNLLFNNSELCKEWDYSRNKKNPEEYTPFSHQEVWWICGEGHKWKAGIKERNYGNGCPRCNDSKGEKAVEKWLKQNNIEFIPQYKFDDCKNIRKLPFDFYLPKFGYCIEYDGEFHFKPARFSKDKDKMLKKLIQTQTNDKIKTNYCLKNYIPLLRIPYLNYDNIEQILANNLQ